jgi:aminoglycoside phosphotransferase (APT) family kinase protein
MTAMGATRMHADEIETDAALVRRMLAGQFPQWADLRIDPVESYRTDHDIYRLGERAAPSITYVSSWSCCSPTARLPELELVQPG